jgi:hypothetical protein
MIGLLIGLLVVCLVVWLAFYIVGQMGLPQPVRMIVLILVGILCLALLFNYAPFGLPHGRYLN